MKIVDALEYGVGKLYNKERPRLESELLLSYVLNVERIYLHLHFDQEVQAKDFESFASLIKRAERDEPLEYLVGKVGFYGYEWEICRGVLIPRPETEILVQKADELIKSKKISKVFELGVGSGVISITLALLNPHLQILASDINPKALELTQRNLQNFSAFDKTLPHRLCLLHENVLENETVFQKQSFELLISNPPYISNSYKLPANVAYEPKEALFGGEGGEEILCALVKLGEKYRIPFLACEMGSDQREKMQTQLKHFEEIEFYQDFAALDRGFICKTLRYNPLCFERLDLSLN